MIFDILNTKKYSYGTKSHGTMSKCGCIYFINVILQCAIILHAHFIDKDENDFLHNLNNIFFSKT